MDGRDRDFEEYSEQDFEDDSMGPGRRSTRGGPPGRGGAGPYDMEDDMEDDMEEDMSDDMNMPPHRGHAGGRGRDHYLMDDDMDMLSHAGHHRGSMDPDADYRMQLALLEQQNAAVRRRRESRGGPQMQFREPDFYHGHAGSRPSQDQNRFMPPSAMLSGSRHGRVGGSGLPRGPNGEPLVEYIDAEEYHRQGRQRHGGEFDYPEVGGSSRDWGRGGDSDDEPGYPPSSSHGGHRTSAAGRDGRRRR